MYLSDILVYLMPNGLTSLLDTPMRCGVWHLTSTSTPLLLAPAILQLPVVLNNNVLMINNDHNDDNDGCTISQIVILP